MRTKSTPLLVIVFIVMVSSTYLLIKSNHAKLSCQKRSRTKSSPAKSSGTDMLFDASFNHLIVSTLK